MKPSVLFASFSGLVCSASILAAVRLFFGCFSLTLVRKIPSNTVVDAHEATLLCHANGLCFIALIGTWFVSPLFWRFCLSFGLGAICLLSGCFGLFYLGNSSNTVCQDALETPLFCHANGLCHLAFTGTRFISPLLLACLICLFSGSLSLPLFGRFSLILHRKSFPHRVSGCS